MLKHYLAFVVVVPDSARQMPTIKPGVAGLELQGYDARSTMVVAKAELEHNREAGERVALVELD